MTSVGQVGINSTSIGTDSNRTALFFGDAVGKQGQWRGSSSGGSWAGSLPNQKADETTVPAEEAKQKPGSQNLRRFYAKGSSYDVDYRVDSWFARAPRDTKKSSSSWTPLFA